jgi:uroporphyrinogen-III synthase
MNTATALRGAGILITRPVSQASTLIEAIEAAGGTAIDFPAVEIAPPEDSRALGRQIGRLREFDLLIFVSPTTVEQAWPLICARHGDWPHGFALAAVGPGSAKRLKHFGAKHVLAPEDGAGSEALLAMPGLESVTGKRILILRGEGGRETLRDTLGQRGATVEYAECYRRMRPSLDPAPLLALWAQGGVRAVTVTSREILDNLVDLLGPEGLNHLRATPTFVVHSRIADAARAHGLTHIRVTAAGDAGLLAALIEHFSSP